MNSVDLMDSVCRGRKARPFEPGARLVRQGERSHSFYMLTRGRVRVERTHPHLLNPFILGALGPGDLVGDLGQLYGGTRSASVVATERAEAVELTRSEFERLLIQWPTLSEKLQRTFAIGRSSTDRAFESAGSRA